MLLLAWQPRWPLAPMSRSRPACLDMRAQKSLLTDQADAVRGPGGLAIPRHHRNWRCGSAYVAQTRAVSLLNRQTAPAAKIASHAMTLTTQVQSTPLPSSGACTSWLSPYSGDHWRCPVWSAGAG